MVLILDLESAAMEGSSHSVQDGQLQSRLKAAEEDARRARMELAQLQAQHAAGAGSSSPRRSRRRASSFNGADMPSVAGERDAAAGAMREAETKIETLERKLSAAVRERDQAVNAKMALQKKAEKEIEEAKDRAMELQYELDAGAFGAERPSNILKQNTKLKADLQDALANLQAVEGSKQALQAEIDDLRSQPPPATDSDLHEARIAELNERIATLQVELEESRARSPTADDKSSDPSTSQLQRELKAAKRRLEVKEREIATLEQDLLDSNEEVEALRRGGAQVQDHTDDKAARITELEERIASVTAELEAVRSETEAQHAELELQLSKATDDLETTRTTMGTERQRLEAELEVSQRAAVAVV